MNKRQRKKMLKKKYGPFWRYHWLAKNVTNSSMLVERLSKVVNRQTASVVFKAEIDYFNSPIHVRPKKP